MTAFLTRRTVLIAGSAAALTPSAAGADTSTTVTALAEIERSLGGRLGLAAVDTANGRRISYREDERFPLCSTFKLIAAGLILARVDRGEERLERQVVFGPEVVVAGSPLTGPRAGRDGMSLAEICRAAITRSDNTAGNLMLASFGGPSALTAFLRGLGDETTRLDRTETSLNEALPGDARDTTATAAMLATTRALLLGDTLSETSRRQLGKWLLANETGGTRIRAGVSPQWRVGDKTGTGERGAANDVAILWPPDRPPILMAVYLHGSAKPLADLNIAIATAARVAVARLDA